MSLSTIWGYILGRNTDVSGRCEAKRQRQEEQFERSLSNFQEKTEQMKRTGNDIAVELALDRLAREKVATHASKS